MPFLMNQIIETPSEVLIHVLFLKPDNLNMNSCAAVLYAVVVGTLGFAFEDLARCHVNLVHIKLFLETRQAFTNYEDPIGDEFGLQKLIHGVDNRFDRVLEDPES